MTRKDFIAKSLVMGIGLPFLSGSLLTACGRPDSIFPQLQTNFTGKVTIVGAGAAGLAAGYLLKRYGVDFEIIEAAPVYGGRLKKAADFADFPIDLGAEWLHTHPRILADIRNKPDSQAAVDIIVYNPQTIQSWHNGRLSAHNYIRHLYSEWKFKDSTWFDFFEQHIVPEVADRLVLDKPIAAIDYTGPQVVLRSTQNDSYLADKVLVTVPIKLLQNEQIQFSPALPADKSIAINQVSMGDGIKIFVAFRERFYPDFLAFGKIFQALEAEEKFVYDAAFRKESSQNILGLFAINEPAAAYAQLPSEQAIIDKFLAELDEIFDGKASANYLRHRIQNWSKAPYIQGAYSYGFAGDQAQIVQAIEAPLAGKIYFAGEALSIANQATVHGACQSAYSTIARMMQEA